MGHLLRRLRDREGAGRAAASCPIATGSGRIGRRLPRLRLRWTLRLAETLLSEWLLLSKLRLRLLGWRIGLLRLLKWVGGERVSRGLAAVWLAGNPEHLRKLARITSLTHHFRSRLPERIVQRRVVLCLRSFHGLIEELSELARV